MERITMKGDNAKGQMRVVEVILASFVIIFALSFANIFAVIPTSPKYEVTELEKLGYNVLHDLDKQGLLPLFVYGEDWNNLEAALRVSLPMDVYFNLTIYDLNGAKINDEPIFYGDALAFENSKNVASVTYGLVGHDSYNPRILVLRLVRG